MNVTPVCVSLNTLLKLSIPATDLWIARNTGHYKGLLGQSPPGCRQFTVKMSSPLWLRERGRRLSTGFIPVIPTIQASLCEVSRGTTNFKTTRKPCNRLVVLETARSIVLWYYRLKREATSRNINRTQRSQQKVSSG